MNLNKGEHWEGRVAKPLFDGLAAQQNIPLTLKLGGKFLKDIDIHSR
jgi:hypothetical protein